MTADHAQLRRRLAARAEERVQLLEQRTQIDQRLGALTQADAADRELSPEDVERLHRDPHAIVDVLEHPPLACRCPIRSTSIRPRHYALADLRRWMRDGLRLGRRVDLNA